MIDRTPLIHAADADLAAAVHENLYELFRSMRVLPGYEAVESAELSYHHAFPANAMFKGVWGTRLSPGDVETKIDETLAWFGKREAPYFFWWTDSRTQPADLPERLLKRGFDGNLVGDPGMAADLHALNEDIPSPDRLAIAKVADQKGLEDWRDVFTAAYGAPVHDGQGWVDATLGAGMGNAPWQLYLGYLDGKPVATSMLFLGAGVAGVYAIGALPEERGEGIGSAITLKPLLDARELGYSYAVLFATRLGYPVYRRLGFQEVKCKIGIFILEPD